MGRHREPMKLARAVVYNNERILVLQNSNDDSNYDARGTWEIPGGTVEDHDNHEREAVLREVKEETGLDCEIEEELDHVINYSGKSAADTQYYLVRAPDRNVQLSDEHQDYRWIRPQAFKGMNWLDFAGFAIPILERLKNEL